MEKNVQTINSLARGLKILDIIHEHGKIGVTELSKFLGVNKSSAYRLLITLEEYGYVEQIGENGKYTLGLKLCKFREKILDNYDIRIIARPFMETLSSVTGEAAGLSIMKDNKVILIDCCNSPHHLGVILQIGDVEELNCTAHGKAMLYSLPEDEQRRLLKAENLKRHTPNTMTNVEDIIKESRLNKERNYAVDNEEMTLGMRCIATNIYDFNGKVVAAIGISGPTNRLPSDKIPDCIAAVMETANNISRKLGY
ncbi:MAG: IclR family transcriptional regulator [Clostridia bacterium]|nr:IclR family transcriptional regulator [Clostridia bacterium]